MNGVWEDDLRDGKRGEGIVAATLAARGHKVVDVSDSWEYRQQDIDFIVTNKKQTTTLEVKNDLASERTGNLFIETYNINNKSHSYKGWLFYCAAEYIGFLQEHIGKLHIISFEDLKKNIKEHNYRTANNSNASGYLLPVAALADMKSYKCLDLPN